MIHVIAERWAELFTLPNLIGATLQWLCWVLVIGLLSSFGPNRYLRTLLTPPRLVIWLWFIACVSSGTEYRFHHPTTSLLTGLVATVCVLVPGLMIISLIAVVIDKVSKKKDVQGP